MKQTPAIALLLAGASARVGIANQASINALFPDFAGTQGTGLAQVVSGSIKAQTSTGTVSTLVWANTNAYLSSCVNCIRSGNIWCSATILADKATAFAIPVTITVGVWSGTASAIRGPGIIPLAVSTTYASAQDRGTCCWLDSNSNKDFFMPSGWMSMIGGSSPAQPVAAAAVLLFNRFVCPARISTDGGATLCLGGPVATECKTAVTAGFGVCTGLTTKLITENATAWWCSNGRSSTSTGTKTNAIMKYWVPGSGSTGQATIGTAAASGVALNVNGMGDARMDLMLTACRQTAAACGGTVAITTIATVNPATAAATSVRTMATTFIGSGVGAQKCTFVNVSKIGAPTFKIEKSTSTGLALAAAYDVHYAEYTTDAWMQPTLAATNVPIIGTDWNNLRARMYNIGTGVGGNGLQQNPNVWMWVNAAATGAVAGTGLKRWFPVFMAQNQIKLQAAVYATFASAVGTYTPLKTAYDAAIKPPTTKPDFFTTLFSPAKKVVLPMRPNVPTTPGAYMGPSQAPWATGYTTAGAQNTVALVKANQFNADGSRGGYGGWTMGFLGHNSATALTIEKSFGTFGWGSTTTTPVYNAQGQSYTSNLTQMCYLATTNGSCPAGFTTYNTTLKAIVAVSVWANSNAAILFSTTTTGSSFKITFNVSNWKQNAALWAPPTTPTAAAVPNTPAAGAKALAASAAAAAAVAAALY